MQFESIQLLELWPHIENLKSILTFSQTFKCNNFQSQLAPCKGLTDRDHLMKLTYNGVQCKNWAGEPKLLISRAQCDTPALKVTFITEVTILEGRLWPCAAAAMLAMVLRWFIWLIAMVTEAGGRLTGIRGCGIIMKGSSSPETHEEVVGYSMARVMTDKFTGGGTCKRAPTGNSQPAHPPFI